MWLWLLVTTGTLMLCRVSGKPIFTGITDGMTSDGFSSTQKEDTYLRFKPRTRSSNPDTVDTVPGNLVRNTADPSNTNSVHDTPNVPSNNHAQRVSNDGNKTSVSGGDNDTRYYSTMTKSNEEEKTRTRDEGIPNDEGIGDAEPQSIGNGDVFGDKSDKEGTLQHIRDGKLYGEQSNENRTSSPSQSITNEGIYGNKGDNAGTLQRNDNGKLYEEQRDENRAPQGIANGDIGNEEGNGEQQDEVSAPPSIDLGKEYGDDVWHLKDDDAMSGALDNTPHDEEHRQGSNEAFAVDNKADAFNRTGVNNVDMTKDNRENLNKGDSDEEYGQEAVDTEASIDYYKDSDLDSASTEDEDALDFDDVIKTLTQIFGNGIPEARYAISATTGPVSVNQDSTQRNEGHIGSGKVYLHSQPSNKAPTEMTQSEEKAEENEDRREYPNFHAIIEIGQTENIDAIDLDDITQSIISEVESIALPLLQIAQDARPYYDTLSSDNREANPREEYIYLTDATSNTSVAIRENNENGSSDAPLQAINEISIIYKL